MVDHRVHEHEMVCTRLTGEKTRNFCSILRDMFSTFSWKFNSQFIQAKSTLFNALGGSITGLLILLIIILVVWYLREKESRRKTKQFELQQSVFMLYRLWALTVFQKLSRHALLIKRMEQEKEPPPRNSKRESCGGF